MAETKPKQTIVEEALERFERSQTYWSEVREKAIADMKILLGDTTNQWQWPEWALAARRQATPPRPVLTVNKLPQHTSQVTNEVRQNPPQTKVRPVDDKADPDTAEVFNGIIRHIWQNGQATFAVTNACEWQVAGGFGYWRVMTDYVDDGSMEQEIFIRPIVDPTLVYDDPAIQTTDGSDRQWAFIIEDMPRADFRAEYPDAEEVDFSNAANHSWWQEDTVRVAEYWRMSWRDKVLNLYADGSTGYADAAGPGLPVVTSRKVRVPFACWYKITAAEVLEERELPNRFIPLVRVVGSEKIVDGERVVKGLVRNSIDAQRMYNFWCTAYAERVALAGKAPWVGPAGFMEGFEDDWLSANVKNLPALEYNVVYDDNGQPLPPPQRTPAAEVPAGYVQGMMLASDDIKATMGQYDASLGAQSNETSGKAILARQREGDIGTFHFIDNVAKAVEFTGRILIDIIPKTYDTARVARMLGEDGSQDFAPIDPESPQAVARVQDATGKIRRIYNLGVGRYDVVATTGPSYTTKRAEAADFMTQIAQADPTLMQKAGDIIVQNFDMPGADRLSKRLKAYQPPNILQAEEEEESGQPQMPPQIKAAAAQLEQVSQMLDAKGAQLQQFQQQVQDEHAKAQADIASRAAELDGKLKDLQREAGEIEMQKRLAMEQINSRMKDLQMQEMRIEQTKAQARNEIEETAEEAAGLAVGQIHEALGMGGPDGSATHS